MKKSVAAAALAGSLVVGGATGALLFGPTLAGAQTTTTTPGNQSGSRFKSNEDPTHEANETPEQEAAEASGHFHGRGGHAGPRANEDPAHEAGETPEQEAAENARGAGRNGGAPGPARTAPTGPSSGAGGNTALRSGHRF